MPNSWDSSSSSTWGFILIISVLLGSLLAGNSLKRKVPFLKQSLMPASVIGGTILIIIAAIYKASTGEVMFDEGAFNYAGTSYLEMITYHTLALGFIASTLKITDSHLNKQRTKEIINTGVATVSTYLIQGIIGLSITVIIASFFIDGFFGAAGMLFGFGQGTGQAMNYGNIYETQHSFTGGTSFGLTIAAIGFLSASFGGVIHLNVMKKKGKIKVCKETHTLNTEKVEGNNEVPMQENLDKISIQLAFIFVSYALAYAMMYLLGNAVGDGMKSTVYGFNFLLGVLCATIVKFITRFLRKKHLMNREYINNFLLT